MGTNDRSLFPGALEMMILQTLRREPLHGYALAQIIQSNSDDLLQVEEGSLYPALQRMLKAGWVAADWGMSPRNRKVRIYKITPAGRKQLGTRSLQLRADAGGHRARDEGGAVMTWKRLSGEIEAHIEEKALDLIEAGVPEREAWAAGPARIRQRHGDHRIQPRSLGLDVARAAVAGHGLRAPDFDARTPGSRRSRCCRWPWAWARTARCSAWRTRCCCGRFRSPGRRGLERRFHLAAGNGARPRTCRIRIIATFATASRSFADLAAYDLLRVRFAKQPDAPVELRSGLVVTGNFFAAMQVEPELGRVFRPQENEVPGRDAVVVLSHAFWKTQFAADPEVLGRTVRAERHRLHHRRRAEGGIHRRRSDGLQPDFYLPIDDVAALERRRAEPAGRAAACGAST